MRRTLQGAEFTRYHPHHHHSLYFPCSQNSLPLPCTRDTRSRSLVLTAQKRLVYKYSLCPLQTAQPFRQATLVQRENTQPSKEKSTSRVFSQGYGRKCQSLSYSSSRMLMETNGRKVCHFAYYGDRLWSVDRTGFIYS